MRHQAAAVELPVFVAVAAIPILGIVMPFVGETHSEAIAAEEPEFAFKTSLPEPDGVQPASAQTH
jgi:hypothetical protein